MQTTNTQNIKEVQKVPKLRFSEFFGDWFEKRMRDIAKINQGLQIAISERYTEPIQGGYFYITNEFLREKSEKKYYIKNPPESVLCVDEDILMTRTGNTGMVVTGVSGAFHNNFFKIKYKKNCDRWFLYYYLNLRQTQNMLLKLAGTSTIPDLNHSDFYRIKINLPSLPEQQKIASFLTVVDKKIQQLTRKKELLEQYKKALMQKIFSQQIRFKDESGKDYQVWEEKHLEDVFVSKKGYGLSKESIAENGKFKCILYGELYTTYSEVITNVINRTNVIEGCLSQKGDLLIPCSTTTTGIDLANVTVLAEDEVRLGGDITILRFTEFGDSLFYAYYLTHHKKYEMAKYAQGITIVHLYFNHFKRIMIAIPPVEEQSKIGDFILCIDEKMDRIKKQITETQQFKKGLLQQMFV